MWQGRIWEARPEIVVQDSPELLAFYMPPGTLLKETSVKRLEPTGAVRKAWRLNDVTWRFGGKLRLSVPGRAYSVILLRNSDGSPHEWYINLEQPLQRTEIGFDYADEVLDVIVAPDLSRWRWEDEDELAEVVSAGLFSEKHAIALHAEGRAAVAALQSGKSVFSGWENWRPDPSWPVPVLSADWDTL